MTEATREERRTVLLESPEDVKPYVHQFMPALSPEAYDALKEDIRENGVLMPLLVDEDYAVVDGHNRVKVWFELLEEGDDPSPVAAHVIPGLNKHTAHNLAIGVNIKRRHMTPPQKRELVAQELRYLAEYYEEQGYTGEQTRSWDTSRLARHLAVSRNLALDVRREMEGSDEIPTARYFVRVSFQPSLGRLQEQVTPRESLLHNTFSVESGSSSDDPEDTQTKETDEASQNSTFKLSDGSTLEAKEVEDILAFYRAEQEEVDELPAVVAEQKGEVRQQHPGALETLEELGIEIPEIPKGYTYEEKVYQTLAEFRDRLLKMPSDPKAVARSTEGAPLMAAAAYADFRNLSEWLAQFADELKAIVEEVKVNDHK